MPLAGQPAGTRKDTSFGKWKISFIYALCEIGQGLEESWLLAQKDTINKNLFDHFRKSVSVFKLWILVMKRRQLQALQVQISWWRGVFKVYTFWWSGENFGGEEGLAGLNFSVEWREFQW